MGILEGGAGEGARAPGEEGRDRRSGDEGRESALLMALSSSTLKEPTGILLGATGWQSADSSPRRTWVRWGLDRVP